MITLMKNDNLAIWQISTALFPTQHKNAENVENHSMRKNVDSDLSNVMSNRFYYNIIIKNVTKTNFCPSRYSFDALETATE